jgi:hypothetical protein
MLSQRSVNRWDLDLWELYKLTQDSMIGLLSAQIFKHAGLWNGCIADDSSFHEFFKMLRKAYMWRENPYHNEVHACDVLQATNWVCATAGFEKLIERDDYFAMLFTAVVHDVGHTGRNNVFHTKTSHEMALRYNDKSILENMHVAIAYGFMFSNPAANLMKHMDVERFNGIRVRTISMVLSTDMSTHFAKLGQLKAQKSGGTFPDKSKPEHKHLLMDLIVHACDVSNPARKTSIYVPWTGRIIEEFFTVGDLEKAAGLPPSMFMDRNATNIAKCQTGFIDFIVSPLYQALEEVFPTMEETTYWLKSNKEFWATRVDQMEEQMKNLDNTMPVVPQEWLAEHTKHVANMDHNLGARQIGKRDSKGDARDD